MECVLQEFVRIVVMDGGRKEQDDSHLEELRLRLEEAAGMQKERHRDR